MSEAPSPDIPSWATYARITGICLVVAVLLAVSGAFNTTELNLGLRVTYWLSLMLPGVAIAIGAGNVLGRVFRIEGPWMMGIGIVLAVTVLQTPLVLLFNQLMMGTQITLTRTLGVIPSVACVAAALTAVSMIMRAQRPPVTHAAPPGAEPPKFLARIPPKLQGCELYAVEAEDHYLRLHTSLGQDLILARLGDAVAELEGLEGAQTHRSWWVAKDAVVAAERGDGRATLTLKGGAKVPVSRAYAKALREAGWF